MEIMRLAVTLVLSLEPVPAARLDVDLVMMVRVDVPSVMFNWLPRFGGLTQHHVFNFALPHLIVVHSEVIGSEFERIVKEEMTHTRQLAAMGPGFVVAYALSGGVPFEEYLGGALWEPPSEMIGNCPLLRFTSHKIEFMPCWRVGGW